MEEEENTLLCIGSANTEVTINVPNLRIGSKCYGTYKTLDHSNFQKKHYDKLPLDGIGIGGSSVNWALRLKALIHQDLECQIYVCSPIANDERGKQIRNILDAKEIKFFETPGLSISKKTTTHSTILTSGMTRTPIIEKGTATNEWAQRLDTCITDKTPLSKNLVAMIGNIPAKQDAESDAAAITSNVIEALKKKDVKFIYCNFGKAQYQLCFHHWSQVLPDINCLQLNIDEAREFVERSISCATCINETTATFGKFETTQKKLSLFDIMRYFQHINSTVVITLAGSGSIAVIRDDSDKSLVFTWPQVPDAPVVDTTGSGDAFGAGVVYRHLTARELNKKSKFISAFSAGSLWGAKACQGFGGPGGTLKSTDLQISSTASTESNEAGDLNHIVRPLNQAGALLYMLDQNAF